MIRRLIMFLVRTYLVRVGLRLRKALSVRNILGESVGLWWDMRKIR